MFSVFIRWRTIGLLAAVVLGLGMLILGWLEFPGKLAKRGNDELTSTKNSSTIYETQKDQYQLEKSDTLNTGKASGNKNSSGETEFFTEYRLEREQINGRQAELLREIINNPASSSQVRQQAQEGLLAISNKLSKEIEAEQILRARGFKNNTVCLEDKRATVVVQADNLSSRDNADIRQVVSWGTGVDEKNIIIILK